MLRWHAKVICGLIMAVAMPICFLLPIKMTGVFTRWGARGQYVLDLLTCFAGGVFLASYLVFMAPAVRVLIEDNLMQAYDIEFPLPDAIIGLGFFMMLLLDKIVKMISTRNKKKSTPGEEKPDQIESNGVTKPAKPVKQNPDSSSSLLPPQSNYTSDVEKDQTRFRFPDPLDLEEIGIGLTLSPNQMSPVSRDSVEVDLDGIGLTLSPNHMTASGRRSRMESGCSEHCHSPPLSRRQSIAEAAVDGNRSITRSLVMMLALSIDSVLEGLTIGLKKSVIEVWAIFVGIIIHESVIAFCLGLQLVRLHKTIRPVVLASIIYTIMNPLGVLVATLVYETAEADSRLELANGILQGLTAGCFIYIVFYEILEGQIDQDTPLGKILATFFGYIFLASFAAIPGSSSYPQDDDDEDQNNIIVDYIGLTSFSSFNNSYTNYSTTASYSDITSVNNITL